MKFEVSHIGQPCGPWTLEEILARLGKMELLATDFVFDESANDWVPLMQFKPIAEAIAAMKPAKRPPTVSKEMATAIADIAPQDFMLSQHGDTPEWFIERGSHRFGPLSFWGVIRGLQDKSIFEYEMIWRDGMDSWVRLAEHAEFAPEKIRQMVKDSKVAAAFCRRGHTRYTYMNDVIIHDNASVYMGQTFQVGEGGVGIIIENAMFVPGNELFLHFSAHDGLPAFNAKGVVVSKRYVKDLRNMRSPIPYGIQFTSVDAKIQEALKAHFETKIAA